MHHTSILCRAALAFRVTPSSCSNPDGCSRKPAASGAGDIVQASGIAAPWLLGDLFSDSASSISYEPLKAAVSDGSIIQHLPFREWHGSGADDEPPLSRRTRRLARACGEAVSSTLKNLVFVWNREGIKRTASAMYWEDMKNAEYFQSDPVFLLL
jgi:hypothetical protein